MIVTMVSFEHFERMVTLQWRRIPRRFRAGVHVLRVERGSRRHPGSVAGLYDLGTYQTDDEHLGPAVTIYYGSFRRVFAHAHPRQLRREVAKTLAHELLHHWELSAGRDELGDEDRRQLARWRQRLGGGSATPTGRSLLEALLFVYCLLLALAVAAAFLD